MRTVSIHITGKVQGVFFRQSSREKAIQLDIRGTVENLPDGSVYILAAGENEAIEAFIEWCNIGPARAEIAEAKWEEQPLNTGFRDFYIIR